MAVQHIHNELVQGRTLVALPDFSPQVQAKTSQLLRIELDLEALNTLRRSSGSNEISELRLGPSPMLIIADSVHPVTVAGGTPKEHILLKSMGKAALTLCGTVSHCLALERAKGQLLGVEAARHNLQSQISAEELRRSQSLRSAPLSSASKGKPPPKASVLRPNSRPDRSSAIGRPQSSSPAIHMHGSPTRHAPSHQSVPTSAPSVQTENHQLLSAAKRPFNHLLAIRPATAADLTEKVGISRADANQLLKKYAKEAREPGLWELADRSYRELDIWAFNYSQDEDRASARDNARRAFDRMRIPVTETTLWDRLLTPKDRGKGIRLSKLQLGLPKQGLGIHGAIPPPSEHRKLLADAIGDASPRLKPSGSPLSRVMQGKKPLKHQIPPKGTVNGAGSPRPLTEAQNKATKGAVPRASATSTSRGSAIQIDDAGETDKQRPQLILPIKTTPSSSDKVGVITEKRKVDDDDRHQQGTGQGHTTGEPDGKRPRTSDVTVHKPQGQAASTAVQKSQAANGARKQQVPASDTRGTSAAFEVASKARPTTSISEGKSQSSVGGSVSFKDPAPHVSQRTLKHATPTASSPALLPSPSANKSTQEAMVQLRSGTKATPFPTKPLKATSTSTASDDPKIDEYDQLQAKYALAFRKNMHLRLAIYTMPDDIRTTEDERRSNEANEDMNLLAGGIRALLSSCTDRCLRNLNWDSATVAEMRKKNEAFDKGEGVEPYILLPDNARTIVDEVVGWREFAAAKLVALRRGYDERRKGLEKLEEDSEERQLEGKWLMERLLLVRQLEGVLRA